MKYLIIIATALTLTSCMDLTSQTTETRIDPTLQPYVDRFFAEAHARGVNVGPSDLIVEFVADIPNALGKSIGVGDQRRVIIDRADFDYYVTHPKDSLDPTAPIENLIFHELGHAILGRAHNDPNFSIMASLCPLRAYQGNDSIRTVLVNELFKN